MPTPTCNTTCPKSAVSTLTAGSSRCSGFKFNFELRHLEVKVYGDAAVVTGYVMGTVTSPEGTTEQFTTRRTAVLIKQGGEWKEAHAHSSPLTVALPQ
jgi:ketosteroid isomerase-like protein